MGTRKITLFEYHSHDGRIDLFSSSPAEDEIETEEASAGSSGGTRAIEAIIGLLFLVAVGMAIRYLRKGESDAIGDSQQVSVTEFEE